MTPRFPNDEQKPLILIHHAATNGHHAPPGSLAALESCLQSGAAIIEIDVLPLSDGSFALLHDQDLAADTNGAGKAPQKKREAVEGLCYKVDGKVSDERVGFLEGAIDLLKSYPNGGRLQIDLKPFTPLSPPLLAHFQTLIDPVMDRVQVSSVADWAVRALSGTFPDLALGYDPLLYLDVLDQEPRSDDIPPFRVGSYGLLDDHPLSAFQWGTPGDYFAARAEALLVQAPVGCEWFIRADLLMLALEAGFEWIDFLHRAGSSVVAWTIDTNQPGQIEQARTLATVGVDKLTSDAPSLLAEHLPTPVIY